MKQLNKVLLVRFSSIGDIVLTSPIIRTIQNQLNVTLHYLTFAKYRTVLAANPHISRIFTIEDKLTQEILAELNQENYDLIIDLHKNVRTKQLKIALGKPSITFDKVNIAKWLQVNLKWDFLPEKHLVDRYFEMVHKVGVTDDGNGLDYFIPEEEEVDIGELLSLSAKANQPQGAFIAIAIGAAHSTKRIPGDKLVELIDQLKQPVLLLGGPGEVDVGEFIRLSSKGNVINLCGKLSINGSASVIKQSRVLVSNDTGMMHIGAALQKPILSFWGSTIPKFGMYPFYGSNSKIKDIRMEVAGLKCRPCSKIGFDKCPKGHFRCMERQEMGLAKEEINSLFNEG